MQPIGPQQRRSTNGHDVRELESVPLFMTSLPNDDTDNDALTALESLVFDGSPDGERSVRPGNLLLRQTLDFPAEVALNFKETGNAYYKARRHKDAAGFYPQGIDAKPPDQTLLEALLLNRAACNLELGDVHCC